MNQLIKFKIDGAECMGQKGQYIVDAARENNIYIPTLCNIPGSQTSWCMSYLQCTGQW
jgi:NADH dehydrogenase/NADH:ubiquinone oxidoreductase subunit G